MEKYQVEGNYIIAENETGELYIYIKARSGTPEHPRVIYDGRDHALLEKNKDMSIVLDYVNPDVRDKLRKTREVIIVETLLENIKDAYWADMNIVGEMPASMKSLNLKTWEEVSLKK